MTVQWSKIISKADWVKIIILLIIAIICWGWVWKEYQKPIIPPEWDQEFLDQAS